MTPAIVSVHHHLRPGGVTRVITATDRILRGAGIPHLVLTSETPGLGALDYDDTARGDLARLLLEAAAAAFGERPRVWHFHNPCLGRNPALTRSLVRLAERGEAMILQHHDLAEDGRPRNLAVLDAVEVPYPDSPRIAHAFLNPRDRRAFLAAGLDPARGLLLPNPRNDDDSPGPPPDGPARVLLPMRGLPRKNLGEFLLLAAAAPDDATFAQGSAPVEDRWRPAYEAWRDFAAAEVPSARFGVFADHPPAWWLDHSTHLLTTSRREGFGLVHLEGAGRRRVLGRRLADLELDGFPQDGLYDALHVGGGGDFAALDDDAQREVIRAFRIARTGIDVVAGGHAVPLRDWLAAQLADRRPRDASAALAQHSDAAHLRRLLDLCGRLVAAPVAPVSALDRHLISAAFR